MILRAIFEEMYMLYFRSMVLKFFCTLSVAAASSSSSSSSNSRRWCVGGGGGSSSSSR